MSIKLLNTIAPGYNWKKTGVNIYTSSDGTVEASILHHGRPHEGHAELTLRWASGLAVEGWVRDGEQDADGWRATKGEHEIDALRLPLLPYGTEEVVWGIFVLLEIARRKSA